MTRRGLLAALGSPGAGKTRVRVPVVVSKGELSAVEATVDGAEAKVSRVKGPKDDLLVLLVLDFAGEIAPIEAVRGAAGAALEALPGNVWVTVLRAQDGLRVLADPSGDRVATLAAINEYAGGGKAGLLDTVEQAARLGDRLLDKSGARVAVLYVTDSNVYNYREDFTNPVINSSDSRDLSRRFPDQLVREKVQKLGDGLQTSETPVWMVHVSYRVDAINEAYQRGLQQLAEGTGGQAVICRSLTEIPEAVGRAMVGVREQWTVVVELPVGKMKNVTVGLKAPECEMTYRERFMVRR